jgi:1-acyl-sn-glycerol-3-phosphate acyltransferase
VGIPVARRAKDLKRGRFAAAVAPCFTLSLSSSAILSRVERAPRPSWFYSMVAVLSWPLVKVVFRHRAYDIEKVPASGGLVLASNHWSNLDPWALGIPRRFLRFMAKSELFWFPLGAIVTAGGGFRVRRGERDEAAIATGVALCREGHAVVMFPEGTRRRKGLRKKHEARWRTGAARIALEAGVPLVPAAVSGTERLARLGPLRVRYGDPVELSDLGEVPPADAARVATDRLEQAVTELEESLA